MSKKIVISERDSIAAVMENGKVSEFFITKGDVLFALTTSGKSINVIRAVERAKELGLKTIAMTGSTGGSVKYKADITIKTPSDITNNIQEMHIAIGHLICDIIEKEMFK